MNEETAITPLILPGQIVEPDDGPLPPGVRECTLEEANTLFTIYETNMEKGDACYSLADAALAEFKLRRGYRKLNYRSWAEFARAKLPYSYSQANRRIAKYIATVTGVVQSPPAQQVAHHAPLVAVVPNTPTQTALPMEAPESEKLDKDHTYNLAWQRRYAKNGYREPTREEVLSEMEVIRAERAALEAERPSVPALPEAAAESAPPPAPLEGEVLPAEEKKPWTTPDGGIIRNGMPPPTYAPTRKKREPAGPAEPLPDVPFAVGVRYICEEALEGLTVLARDFEQAGKDAVRIRAAVAVLEDTSAYLESLEEQG